MKHIILGIKDYCKDCWHDFWFWVWSALWGATEKHATRCYNWRYNEGLSVKEGSVWHYIRQRKITDKRKKHGAR